MVVRIYKDLDFSKATKKSKVSDEVLVIAVYEAESGLVDAYLGGECIKKRIARSGGFRTVLAFRRGQRAVYVHLFAKNDEANISREDLADLKVYAATLLGLTEDEMAIAVRAGSLVEIL